VTFRDRALRLSDGLLRRVCRGLPNELGEECHREWSAELPAILDDRDRSRWLRWAWALLYVLDQRRTVRQLTPGVGVAGRVRLGRRGVLLSAAAAWLTTPVAAWWLVGDQFGKAPSGFPPPDYLVPPPPWPLPGPLAHAIHLAGHILGPVLVMAALGAVALLVRASRRRHFDRRWWGTLVPVLIIGAVLGVGYRLVTSGAILTDPYAPEPAAVAMAALALGTTLWTLVWSMHLLGSPLVPALFTATAAGAPALEDHGTVSYFESHSHDYTREGLRHPEELIKQVARPGASLIDVGCGTGNVLAKLARATGLSELWALDVSENGLARTRERVACNALRLSILDEPGLAELRGRFDFVVAAAVLHHLVGRTRRQSRRLAERGFANALSLVKPGGYLIILEPTFTPPRPLDLLFWVKKAGAAITSKRIPVFGYWVNIGAPVVSFYSPDDLVDMIPPDAAASVVDRVVEHQSVSPAVDWLLHKTNTTLIVRRASPAGWATRCTPTDLGATAATSHSHRPIR
jgi:SAM-dependent methyltransferase